jgi:hypothetical protein
MNCYQEMFAGCTNLIDIEYFGTYSDKNPPITKVNSFCCSSMFKDCTAFKGSSTTIYWSINTTKIGSHAFSSMFKNCTALESLGHIFDYISAESTDSASFLQMCANCTSLKYLCSIKIFDTLGDSAFS